MNFECPNPKCRQPLEVADKDADGFTFTCPNCGLQIEIESESSNERERETSAKHSSNSLSFEIQLCPKCKHKISSEARKCPHCRVLLLNQCHREAHHATSVRATHRKSKKFVKAIWLVLFLVLPILVAFQYASFTKTSRLLTSQLISAFRPLDFTITSQTVTKSYNPINDRMFNQLYAGNNLVTGIKVVDGYSFLVVNFTVSNRANRQHQFASDQFRLIANNGRIVKADLVGLGQGFVLPGTTTSVERTGGGVSYKGVLGGEKSFMTWDVGPNESYSDTLVFLISSADGAIHCEFK